MSNQPTSANIDPSRAEDPSRAQTLPPSDPPERDDTLIPGTYVSDWFGQYAIPRMLTIASAYGFKGTQPEDAKLLDIAEHAAETLSWREDTPEDTTELLIDLADDAETWLNEFIVPEGMAFGWWEGDFKLMRVCEDGDECTNQKHEFKPWTCQWV